MTGAAAPVEQDHEAAPSSLLDRTLGLVPIASIVVWLTLGYMLESTQRSSPTLFSDEVEWAQLSRGIAATGHALQRSEPAPYKSLYSFLLAPAWWIHDTAQAYDVTKYLTVFVMCLAAIPAYLLARRLVSKPAALFVAAATISIPSMAYGLYLIPEGIAYAWTTLCAFLIVGALATRSRRWIAAAVVASVVAPEVRGQLVLVPAAFALAALELWWLSPRGRALRRTWSRGDGVGLALLLVGVFFVVNRWLLHDYPSWEIPTEFYRGWIFKHVHWALGALTIGVGVLPVVGTVVGLVPRRDEPRDPWQRSFIAVTVAYLLAFCAYTGIKAAYLEYSFATRVTERNLFYVAPLLFLATAIAFERRRIRLWTLAAGVALAAALIATTPLQLDYPYFEAFGFSILSWANRGPLYLSTFGLENALYAALAVSAAVLLAAWAIRRRPLPAGWRTAAATGAVAAGIAVVAWNLGGQVTAARASGDLSDQMLAGFPFKPPTWIDRMTGGGSVTYLGQQLGGDVAGIDLLEFWNRSVKHLWSLDGTTPGPGPTLSPDLASLDGTLSPAPGTDYLLADSGVDPVGTPVASVDQLRLYRLHGPIRLRTWTYGVGSDGWMVSDASYTRFATPGNRGGYAVVDLSRTRFCPPPSAHAPAGTVTVTLGTVAINDNHQAVMAHPEQTRTLTLPNCASRTVRIRTGPPPWRVQVHVDGTFVPADYGSPDVRTLGAVVDFGYARR